MARETRGSAHAPVALDVPASDSPAVPKRKRQSSTSVHTEPNAPRPISLKVTLPAQSGAQGGPKVRLNVSPNKVDPEPVAAGGAKRQRISLKVKGGKKKAKGANGDAPNGDGDAEAKDPNGTVEDEDSAVVDDDADGDADVKGEETVEVQEKVVRILSEEVRDALAVVTSRMAANLPRPLNGVLTLFLPPSFGEKEENTLGFILKQSDLSWERLVELLHTFATHLLQPCAYPCPFPPLSHIHTSIPPLPPHQPPHVIYDFCSSMRDLILSIEPHSDAEMPLAKVEKWGLMMRVPGGSEGRGAGEWWTGIADWREAEKMKSTDAWVKEENDEGVLERLAADGNKFGYANAVSIASLAGTASGQATAPRLGDSLVRKASLKAQRWKEQLARRKGGFGSVQRPVTIPRVTTLPWTPAFAPTYDSNYASGGVGYWATLEAMHQRNRYRPWTGARKAAAEAEGGAGYWGCLESDKKDEAMIVEHDDAGPVENGGPSDLLEEVDGQKNGRERTADDVLKDNAEWLNELLGWQEVRVRRGNKVASDRENVLAEELLNSLSTLSSTLPPSSLIPDLQPGFAHTTSRRLIHTPGPVVRGTLDPRRPRAIHDSTTIRPRPSTGMSMPPIPSSGSMSNPPSIAQQLAGGSGRSTTSYVAGGYAGTPTPSYNPQNQSRSGNYGYQSSSVNGASRSGYPSSSMDHRQTTPASGSSRPSYSHTPFFPGSTNLPPQSGNTIYSRSGGQQASSSQVMMSPSGLGGGGSPSPTIGVGYGQGTGQGRPGMMPSGLRQSFGPETSSAPRSGTGSPAVHGLQGSGGYFSGIAGINRG